MVIYAMCQIGKRVQDMCMLGIQMDLRLHLVIIQAKYLHQVYHLSGRQVYIKKEEYCKMKKSGKKLIVVMLMTAIAILAVACEKSKDTSEGDIENMTNVTVSMFDESYYDDVKAISLFGQEKIIEETKTIAEIKNLILNVTYSETDKNISDYYGTTILTMVRNDGSSWTVSLTSDLISDGEKTYLLEDDICSKIRDYFN